MAAITTRAALEGFDLTTVTFEDIANLDGQEFASGAGQPYAHLGLVFQAASVRANAGLTSESGGVAASTATIYFPGYQNSLMCQFSYPQRAVGFFYRDPLASSLTVRAFDSGWQLIEEEKFPGGEGYAGIVRENADIAIIQTRAPHQSIKDADQSRTYIDDVSFARKLHVKAPGTHGPQAEGVVVMVLGGVRVDGGGIVIGPDGVPHPVPPWNPEFKEATAAAGLLAQAEHINDLATRREIRELATSLLKASVERLLRAG
jgi:hypothetical protein